MGAWSDGNDVFPFHGGEEDRDGSRYVATNMRSPRLETQRAADGAGEARHVLMARFDISKSTFYRLCPGGQVDGECAGEKQAYIG